MFFLKYVLYVFNFIFWLSGAAILAVGIWTLISKHSYVTLLASSTYVATTYILVATGAIIILVGFLGCCGAWRENRYLLMVYAGFLLLIFLLEAVSGVIAYMYEAALHDELSRSLNDTMLQNYHKDADMTEAIDDLQQKFKCCGAEHHEDWAYSVWRKTNPSLENIVPDSCCKSMSYNCAITWEGPSNIYYDSCITQLEHFLREHLIIIGAVGLGLCLLQIFGIIFACCLARRIKEWEDRQKTYSW